MEFCNGMMYAVKSGDTLYSISMKYNIPLAVLLRANPYVDVYNLQVGETICVPVKQNQGCRYTENGRCIWERGEDADGNSSDNAGSGAISWRENRGTTAEENASGTGGSIGGGQQGGAEARPVLMEAISSQMEEEQMVAGTMPGTASQEQPVSGPMSDRGREEQPVSETMQGRMWEGQAMAETMSERAWEEQPMAGPMAGTMPGTMQQRRPVAGNMSGNRSENDRETTDRNATGGNTGVCCNGNTGNNSQQWKRYVTQPGDTLGSVIRNCKQSKEKDMEDILEEFVEKNGIEQIYLLPGIGYSCQR